MKSNFSSGKSSAAQRKAEPALLTRMSTRPSSWLTESASGDALRTLGHVEGHGAGLAALRRDGGLGRLGALQIDIGDDDPDAHLGEARGDGRAQPAAAAGDDGDTALEVEEPRGIAGGDR